MTVRRRPKRRAADRRLHPRHRRPRHARHVGIRRDAPAAWRAGSKVALLVIRNNATDPHELSLVRERPTAAEITTRMANASTGYMRIAEFTKDAPTKLTQAVGALTKTGATRFVIDLRGTATGDIDNGIAAARLFVASGTLAIRQTKASTRNHYRSGERRLDRRARHPAGRPGDRCGRGTLCGGAQRQQLAPNWSANGRSAAPRGSSWSSFPMAADSCCRQCVI